MEMMWLVPVKRWLGETRKGSAAALGGSWSGKMSEAVKLIVDTYVRLKRRQDLEEIREHRRKLVDALAEWSGGRFDVSKSIQVCNEDIEIVEAGLSRL
jgi:hypothetical protein